MQYILLPPESDGGGWFYMLLKKLNVNEVFSIIRDHNIASQNVARRNGMTIADTFVKHYRGIDMPHYLFSVKRVL